MIWVDMIWVDMIWVDMIWVDMIWVGIGGLVYTKHKVGDGEVDE
jgi:hypothetical protein